MSDEKKAEPRHPLFGALIIIIALLSGIYITLMINRAPDYVSVRYNSQLSDINRTLDEIKRALDKRS